ncbi:NAD(P)-dependent oxidoreductase [Pseudactinotalea sp. Z1732]|uniref:NAD(P)-dependent oxidoreductase n=1 Tax=Micrococcales TaxID=85006 RepID=UPI003C7B6108
MTFSFTLLGLGAMGGALAATALDAGHVLTVWNRTPGKDTDLVDRGAQAATSAGAAISGADLVVVCLFDYASVRAALHPHTETLTGRTVINLTTTTPEEARELARWAREHRIDYLDGAIMSTPRMIGTPESVILYSGSAPAFHAHEPLLQVWGSSTFDGDDPGMASMWDLAMLSGMYSMFAGFLHGVAMLETAGVGAAEYAGRAAPFLAAMTSLLGHSTERLDARDYSEALQSLHWTTTQLGTIARASREQGITPAPMQMVQELIQQQIDAGHGAEDFDRIIESMR